ncbi:MAG: ATP-dependent protease ATPase subunit HslU [Treponemataceae bacterium]
MAKKMVDLTPKEIVEELDHYIIGQEKAKKFVAIAMRNRTRRMKLQEDVRNEIAPKNILMIGPTGCGKTEIARRLAKLSNAPFIKVEATKYTEVGYVGRDVESIIRDLMNVGFAMVKDEMQADIKDKAEKATEEDILDLLLPRSKKVSEGFLIPSMRIKQDESNESQSAESNNDTREKLRAMLREGKLDERMVEVEATTEAPNFEFILSSGNMGDIAEATMGRMNDILSGSRNKKRRVSVKQAKEILLAKNLDRFVDRDAVASLAKERVEQLGIVFIDEIDKVAGESGRGGSGPDISREGVQRDILPIVEGSQVSTKYGVIDTTHILFIAAGAFNISKPSDLIPEFQGRFPLRVELESLSAEDFKRILIEPKNSLTMQYKALMSTENLKLEFSDSAIERISELAQEVNSSVENIGARRLHTLMELVVEDISFNADSLANQTITVDAEYVDERLKEIVRNQDLSKYIL